jgi:hypothetical protein
MRRIAASAVGLLASMSAGIGVAAGAEKSPQAASATSALIETFPGLQIYRAGTAIRAFYGVPMNSGATPDAAVAAFWDEHADAFGVTNLELTLRWSNDVDWNKFTVFAYGQTLDGLPVEYSVGRVLVLNGEPNRVVYASGIFAQPPAAGFAADAVGAAQALASVQAMLLYRQLSIWSIPQLVVYAGTEAEMAGGSFGPALHAWKFTGSNGDLADPMRRTFFVDAASGRLIAARNEVYHTDVTGTVRGMATPGVRPDVASNAPVLTNVPEVRVRITGGGDAFSDVNGAFTITNGGAAAVTVTSTVTEGLWSHVDNQAGAEITASTSVTPPGPAALVFNSTPSAQNTAQVNALIHTNITHNFITDRSSWAGVNTAIPTNVNINSQCNAFFDPVAVSINFFLAGGGCVNSAYTTVVAHEYGHFVVQQLGLQQGGFGEGFGDCLAVLIYNDPVIARDFYGPNVHIRDYSPGQPEDPYPCPGSCGGEPHCCGETLGGLWWDIREQFGLAMGEPAGLDFARQLFVDWLQITGGGAGNNSAHPQTAIEVLTVDDDDGTLLNGSPHYNTICTAFSAHSIPCPALAPGVFVFPDGVPTLLTPDQPTAVRVNVVPIAATITPGSGTVSYRIGGSGSYTTLPMVEGAANEYTATLPAQVCDARAEFYFSVGTSLGPISSPATAPTSVYKAIAATQLITRLIDDFETDQGWTVDPAGTATAGLWARQDPEGTSAQPASDHTPGDGALCWVTDGRSNGITNFYDVDGGRTILVSPTLDFSGAAGATIEYWLWYSNIRGSNARQDVFRVGLSNDDGANWVNAITIGPDGPEVEGGWIFHSMQVAQFVPLTATVRVRFIAEDLAPDSTIEAAIDDFNAYAVLCDSSPCPADLDGDGSIGLQDLAILLSHFGTDSGANPEDGDLDDDDDVDLQDLASLLSAFGTNCP